MKNSYIILLYLSISVLVGFFTDNVLKVKTKSDLLIKSKNWAATQNFDSQHTSLTSHVNRLQYDDSS